jgi:hypothetical protein
MQSLLAILATISLLSGCGASLLQPTPKAISTVPSQEADSNGAKTKLLTVDDLQVGDRVRITRSVSTGDQDVAGEVTGIDRDESGRRVVTLSHCLIFVESQIPESPPILAKLPSTKRLYRNSRVAVSPEYAEQLTIPAGEVLAVHEPREQIAVDFGTVRPAAYVAF